jgi:hypothetical protein
LLQRAEAQNNLKDENHQQERTIPDEYTRQKKMKGSNGMKMIAGCNLAFAYGTRAMEIIVLYTNRRVST